MRQVRGYLYFAAFGSALISLTSAQPPSRCKEDECNRGDPTYECQFNRDCGWCCVKLECSVNKCNKKKYECCKGYECNRNSKGKAKCMKLKKSFQLFKTIDSSESNKVLKLSTSDDAEVILDQGRRIPTMSKLSMSDDAEVILHQAEVSTHLKYGVFKDPRDDPFSTTFNKKEDFRPERRPSAISGDGKVFVIQDNNGTVRTYRREGDDRWYQFGGDVNGSAENFGSSLALSHDGNILVIGADQGAEGRGMIQRYQFNGDQDAWNTIGAEIVGEETNDNLGNQAIDISADGDRIAVGGGLNGFASVYDWNDVATSWAKIRRFSFDCKGWLDCVCNLSCIGMTNPSFGQEHLWLSNDGSILAIGESDYDSARNGTYTPGPESDTRSQGAIHFYVWKKGKFVQFAESSYGPGNYAYFGGHGFDISDDGNALVVCESEERLCYIQKRDMIRNKFVTVQIIDRPRGCDKVSITNDGTKFALGCDYDMIQLFKLSSV